ncbi:unnamed protein product [Owenia fusiformis]|uniref:Solute carrier organic anion transporter family member n=1 Tax=Owenia fusiformis TaxID=6347 RepID=A0A8S4N3C9_OWEFU|nr:unnamed protein product [Owenia fusiformis]
MLCQMYVWLGVSNATDNGCGDIEESLALQNYLYVFMLGQFLHGIGGTTLYSIGIVFIDENVKTKVSALYIGIMYAFSAVGPALGYVAGGQFLNIYVDAAVTNSADISITDEDPRWVGAWWLGFAIGCCGFVVVAAMLFCYGYELPDAKEAKTERYSQAHQDGSEDVANRDGFGKSIKDLPLSTKLILLNPTFMFINLAGCTEGLIISGFATFMPKFIQNQFWQTAGMSAFYGGLVAVIGAAGGQALGGFIAKRFNLKVKGMLKLSMGCCIACVAFVLIFLARCDSEKIGGITVSYINKTEIEESALIADCNRGCNCTSESYEPICGIDGIAYFTPCHAGCLRSFRDGSTKRYANCSCIDTPAESPYSATSGKCEPTCNLLAVFLPIFFIVVTLTFMVSPIGMSASLRVIPDAQRSYSVGIKWVIMRFLGTVPGPILFGAIFDIACRQWQEKCDERGSCWIYDNNSLSLNLLLLGLVIKIISAIFFFVAYLLYKPPPVDAPISLLDKRGKTISENVNNINTTDTQIDAAQGNKSNGDITDAIKVKTDQGEVNPVFVTTL